MSYKKPILVTGASRSGSTWVGRMLAASPSVGYIHEPFNVEHRPGICSAKFDYSRMYVSSENEHLYYNHLRDTLNFKFKLKEGIKALKSSKDVLLLLRDYALFLSYRIKKARPLVKDPIASFSAEWLSTKFNMDVVVLIRHPAAYTLSIEDKNWKPPFSRFLKQPLLMKDHLYPFEEEIKKQAEREHDIIDQAILYWKLIYHVFIQYRARHPDWMFVRHEDLSRNPVPGFQSLFSRLNLEFSEKIKKTIETYSSSSNALVGDSIRRNSRENIWRWKKRLSEHEIKRVREGVEDISRVFYSDEDW
jgi:hypothetical protein